MFRLQSRFELPKDDALDVIDLERDISLKPSRSDFERRLGFIENIEYFLIKALVASLHANSYRNFHVGSVMLAEHFNGNLFTIWGANTKLAPAILKHCAERSVLEQAVEQHVARILGIAVFGPTNRDPGSGLELEVLHPCDSCRPMLDESPLVSPTTPIAACNPLGQYELTTLETILALHDNHYDPAEVNTHVVPHDLMATTARLVITHQLPHPR